MLAAAEAAALTEANPPAADESSPASPEPAPYRNDVDLPKGRMSPKPPRNASEPDDYGLRSYILRLHEKIVHARFCMPRPFAFEPDEIGFRDSSNELSRQKNKTPHKYTGTPNRGLIHVDHRVFNYDYSTLTPDDFDPDMIRRHRLHPLGFFMSFSKNDKEDPPPYVMPGKPVVYLANPSGRTAHASRSFRDTALKRSVDEAPLRASMGACLRRFCRKAHVDAHDIAVADYVESDDLLRAKSLGTAEREPPVSTPGESDATALGTDDDEEVEGDEHQSEPGGEEEEEQQQQQQQQQQLEEEEQLDVVMGEGEQEESPEADDAAARETTDQPDGSISALSVLAYATVFEEAKQAARAVPSTPKTSRYDAIRDVFTTSSRPDPAPTSDDDTLGLNFLARVCHVEPRLPEPDSGAARTVDVPIAAAAPTRPATVPSSREWASSPRRP
ncbi:hypothetical protein CDD83_5699 [Cordyceps sp. RAO-2017]|nr:hypothetical protein CDD83_5699 [Cordyceps sp. RAO-2017]